MAQVHSPLPAPVKFIATQKADQNRASIDPWTAVHLSAGLALGLLDVALSRALPGAVVYEVIEQVFERSRAGRVFFRTPGPESFPNVLVDVAVFVVGHALGRRWNATDAPLPGTLRFVGAALRRPARPYLAPSGRRGESSRSGA